MEDPIMGTQWNTSGGSEGSRGIICTDASVDSKQQLIDAHQLPEDMQHNGENGRV